MYPPSQLLIFALTILGAHTKCYFESREILFSRRSSQVNVLSLEQIFAILLLYFTIRVFHEVHRPGKSDIVVDLIKCLFYLFTVIQDVREIIQVG